MENKYKNKIIMITGAGGSIGSSLCHEILKYSPQELILVDHSEFHLFKVHEELVRKLEHVQAQFHIPKITPTLINCAVKDFYRKYETAEIDFIFNAAAYKHVNLSTTNRDVYFRNNVLSTYYSQQIALNAGAHYVLVSTDKAVKPESVMGKSKRLCEILVLATANSVNKATQHLVVRFGNVLNSSGSVVPIFKKQIESGGPVTVTDPKTTRYFMSITEACNLVLDVTKLEHQDGIFVLDMGQPVNILSLACNMIEQAGKNVTYHEQNPGEIQIQFIGLRPGEKLHETLSYSPLETTAISNILKATEFVDFGEPIIQTILATLEQNQGHQLDTFNWQTGAH